MPLPSREVLTLRLIFDCDGDEEEEHDAISKEPSHPSPLLRLPVELRLKILRYLLRIDRNRKAHTRRPPPNSISELLYLNPRRILEAAPFKHKGNQEINGSPPVINSCHLHPAILKTCRQLYLEAKTVLYMENKVVGLQSGIRGLGAKLKNYGIPVFGPFPSSRLVSAPYDASQSFQSRFDPVMLFSGGNTKSDAPFYICSYKDSADFMHALWIMVKCPFARGMGYNLSLSAEPRYRYGNRTDSFVKFAVLPWLHTHINSITFHSPAPETASVGKAQVNSDTCNSRVTSLRDELAKHVLASKNEPNLHTYKAICAYLEQVLLQGEICVDQGNFVSGELLFERVCYEASSIVRTRTSKLVDVSSKSKDGINRVCKLIAVSAYRLCELRSGALARLITKRLQNLQAKGAAAAEPKRCDACQAIEIPKEEDGQSSDDSASAVHEDTQSVASSSETRTSISEESGKKPDDVSAGQQSDPTQLTTTALAPHPTYFIPRTTRLEPQLAADLALTSGLLALRLPCASPVPEWNIRLDIMLLRLFAERNDIPNAVWSIRRIHSNGAAELQGMKQKNKTGDKKWHALSDLVQELAQQLRPGAARGAFFETADKCQQVVSLLWGERLIPKKGFNGLIWTFRWAG
ncbi:uncharacterized protein Z520_00717 [Fonsecaea multimorphosa CBS 102226]|uniref:F-box domain-containing protein n=1 Tax=Fonsecaea multimorphosa CBS 102226 TaxID=1442371 RepID=A0A0D2KKL9_9EURO|nr:uncharacterized protein Z520_00717 [Fonsecaea multimorphosa CBS 102226]KIY04025.1 hypothetical protein Z520_00717 [Fonsecaea multimorphosa CBS 102226]OAL31861.1 hypothetical protein AYO22_00731 [Fonsecaea multimorphosa]